MSGTILLIVPTTFNLSREWSRTSSTWMDKDEHTCPPIKPALHMSVGATLEAPAPRVDKDLQEDEFRKAYMKRAAAPNLDLTDDHPTSRIMHYSRIADPQFDQLVRGSSLHSSSRTLARQRPPMVYLSRHGQSQANVANLIGMDMGLSPEGAQYAQRLGHWVQENLGQDGEPIIIMRSDMVRTTETVHAITCTLKGGHRLEVRSQLNEINAGAFEGWTFSQFRATAGREYEARKSDKLRYRYPGGESYLDLLDRVDPVVREIQQYGKEGKDVVVVAHQATLRCLIARLTGLSGEDAESIPSIHIPLHTVIQVQRQESNVGDNLDDKDDGSDDSTPYAGRYTVVGKLTLHELPNTHSHF